jgi:predicted dehydrogenase
MIGGGEGAFIGAVHRAAAAMDGQIELVCGSFSRDPRNNQRSGETLGLAPERVYSSWPALLQGEAALPTAERMQLLTIATPNHLHVPVAEAALRAGFHVFSEKPAGIALQEVQRLAQTVVASGRLFGLAHTYLGYPMVQQAREMVRAGELGQLRKIYVEYCQGWMSGEQEESGNKQASWRVDPSQAGISGCMADIGTHAFGLAEFIGGQMITELCAELRSHFPTRQLDDDGAALFRTRAGASGVLIASQVCAGEENNLSIRLYGDKGGLEWRQMEPNSLLLRGMDGSLRIVRAGSDRENLYPAAKRGLRLPAGHPEGYLEAMANLYGNFAEAIRSEASSLSHVPGIIEGERGMAFIEAMTRSRGNWISLGKLSNTLFSPTQEQEQHEQGIKV